MGVTEVVRGMDLLESTARQILLVRALGGAVPVYAHVPLLVNADGEKLSKRDGAVTIRESREAGVRPEALLGWLAGAMGQGSAPRSASDIASAWRWEDVRPKPVVVPEGLISTL